MSCRQCDIHDFIKDYSKYAKYCIIGITLSMKKTKVLLTRHAKTAWNNQGRLQGHTDTAILPEERETVRQLAKKIKDYNVRKVYSSFLTRARETAELIQEELGLKGVEIINDLAERQYGEYEGKKWFNVKKKFEKLGLNFSKDKIIGVEEARLFLKRTLNALIEISAGHENETVVAVTHGGNIRALLEYLNCDFELRKIPNAHFFLFEIDPERKKIDFGGLLD